MVTRNNLHNILDEEEYERLIANGLLKSSSGTSINSDCTTASCNSDRHSPIFPPSMNKKETTDHKIVESKRLVAGTPRPQQPGIPGLKTVKYGRSNGKKHANVANVRKIGKLHIITDIPEHDMASHHDDSDDSVSSDISEDTKYNTPDRVSPVESLLNSTKSMQSSTRGQQNCFFNAMPKGPGKGRTSFISKTPPPETKSSFPKPIRKGHRIVQAKV